MIDPEFELTHGERAHLSALTTMEGYTILNQLMRVEVDKFIVALINADAANDAEVIACHKVAKAAAQFFTAVTNRVKEEVTMYRQAPRATDKPIDITEGLIDLGAIEMPSLLEEMRFE